MKKGLDTLHAVDLSLLEEFLGVPITSLGAGRSFMTPDESPAKKRGEAVIDLLEGLWLIQVSVWTILSLKLCKIDKMLSNT